MFGTPAAPSPRVRNSENKLFEACLDACIEGIENLPVDRRDSATPTLNNHISTNTNTDTTLVATSHAAPDPAASLLSPPPSPSKVPQPPASPPRSPTPPAAMERSELHGAPPTAPQGLQSVPPHLRGSLQQPSWGPQDARSNLAVQPDANMGSMKLKKNAVKIVGAAPVLTTSTASRPAAPSTPVASSPAPGSVKAQPKETEGLAPATSTVAPKLSSSKKENAKPDHGSEYALDSIFARLSTQSPSTLSRTTANTTPSGPDKAMFSFYDRTGAADTAKTPATPVKPKLSDAQIDSKLGLKSPEEKKSDFARQFQEKLLLDAEAEGKAKDVTKSEVEAKKAKVGAGPEASKTKSRVTAQADKASGEKEGMTQEELESEYMRRASKYVDALPGNQGTAAYNIRSVSKKLRSSYVPAVKVDPKELDALKNRFAFAIVMHANKKKGPKPLNADSVKQILKGVDGDFLQLCAKLMEGKYIELENIDDIASLVQIMLDILPKPKPSITEETKPVSTDPVDSMKAWPTQEKRENPAAYRTCVLKGVSGVTSINELQALVWGGKLESISMLEPGSGHALVKFLTPEACEKYFKATENGIEVAGDNRAFVFVEKTAGPNSANDIIQNCIDGDASRCVRAIGSGEDDDRKLMKLARGNSQIKREVDRIKRGKTARDHKYVEFRFANIYHALNFKRELMTNENWEHCTISYASDPCETARGVHYRDADEEGTGFF
ncbi:hypothetical protein EJ02DRAFT_458169 [Clathrospora elynae]|uniref:Uncharacterized protein n=1 Tax=Clathrospora elynae TaxID=706981 RepID=A0A6A5SEV1_9PLEO|nr:hypothetical protein EJ02DRAFT_458169 [Clathrospora elynae]